jgi:hypothetical protein
VRMNNGLIVEKDLANNINA